MNTRLLGLMILAGTLAVSTAARAAADDWPFWRGPTWDGTTEDKKAPTTWSRTEHVVWKTAVPGRGYASPIVVGDRVYLNTADEATGKQSVLAFDRKTGAALWTTVAHESKLPRKNPKNSHASATPAWDGQRLHNIFLNGSGLYLTATDRDGKILWQTKAGEFTSEHGYGSSPVLFKSLVFVNGDSLKDSFLAAFDAATGKQVWKTPRLATGKHGSYGTPVVATFAGKPQLILAGMGGVSSYEPETGKLIWSSAGPSEVTGCTLAWNDSLVFATGGYPEKTLLALKPDGSGDVTTSHLAWRTAKGIAYVPSPVYRDGRLYVVADGGVVTCFEAATGKEVWQDRLAGAFTSSPILAGDRIYVTNEAGKTYVLKAGPKFEVVATNDLAEVVLATPAVCGGRVYLRTEKHLYCLGE